MYIGRQKMPIVKLQIGVQIHLHPPLYLNEKPLT
jgi:hypothetical protein